MLEKIKYYYDRGLYTARHIAAFVSAGVLTAAQYAAVTGNDYVS